MTQSDLLESIATNIKVGTEAVEFGKALERLQANRDFKRVILDGYFKDEAVRLVQLISEPDMQSAEKQQSIHQQMVAIGQLGQYFRVIKFHARQGEKSVYESEELREEILAEEGVLV